MAEVAAEREFKYSMILGCMYIDRKQRGFLFPDEK
jgi:hypothetical protein